MIRDMRRSAALVFGSFLCAVPAVPAMAADWVRVSTPLGAAGQIEILTDAGEKLARHALRQLRRNIAIEIGAGAIILCLVAVLGVTPPGLGE